MANGFPCQCKIQNWNTILVGGKGGAMGRPQAFGALGRDHGRPPMCPGPPKKCFTGRHGRAHFHVFQKCPGTKSSVPGKNWPAKPAFGGCPGENTYKKIVTFCGFECSGVVLEHFLGLFRGEKKSKINFVFCTQGHECVKHGLWHR